MKKLMLSLVTLLIYSSAFSQDIIIKKDGTEIKAKIIEVATVEIKYKKFDNLEGPQYSIAKSEVFMIKYENGTKEIINKIDNEPVNISPVTAPTDNVVIGKLYAIYLKNGNVIRGTITQKDKEKITAIVIPTKAEVVFKLSDIYNFESVPQNGSFGIGLGIEYGTFGFNAEFNIGKRFAITAGFGSTIFAGAGYSIGARYFFRDIGNTWHPRISFHYGTNAVLMHEIDLTEYVPGAYYLPQTFNGLNMGVGQVWWFGSRKKHGLNLDLNLILTSEYNSMEEVINNNIDLYNTRSMAAANSSYYYSYYRQYEKLKVIGTPIKVALGYRYAF